MKKMNRFLLLAVAILFITTTGFADEVKTKYTETGVTSNSEKPYFSFVSYGSLGGGNSFIGGKKPPMAEISSGFQIAPWIAAGVFCAGNPLSNFADANFDLDLANREASYALMSGTEILFTPRSERWLHSIVRIALGGVNVGYLEDLDGEEGYDRANDNRYFYASLSTGVEMNFSKHVRIALRGGWRFVENEYTLGIGKGELSGPEVTISARTLWKTVLD
ncbi:hypothetical protein SpiGrapes_2352 [Sphaerochaeta pleomorpha str. Grapes]|uniref:Outer membrane protein beta-barrel domain-containing protein n=1 Tax=Sphaerochaeta pleomorpha (strain ATCC BAA-1885 / DSM 22778 / Grapes) TaxID=158190 RepID=G8QSU4_SPHPG|nr:hypothetical protein [Sphaerochaeta pleomorpha]AEV30126.1 hypothetical protein SpiGrapes_2352 [Sphaerochaeta pleomorpha str. Grapes]